jgi:hypothetical protein
MQSHQFPEVPILVQTQPATGGCNRKMISNQQMRSSPVDKQQQYPTPKMNSLQFHEHQSVHPHNKSSHEQKGEHQRVTTTFAK